MPTATVDKRSEMTAREYAHSLGLAKMGRGRMSPDAVAAIAKAESEGVVFRKSESELYKEELERRRAAGEVIRKGRKPSGNTSPSEKPKVQPKKHKPVIREGKFSDKVKVSDYDGKPTHPSVDWYKSVFYVGAYVVNPEGMTLFCVSNEPDSEGFTHFVDKHAKKWKAKVNASWGTRKGWPQGGISVNDN